MPDLDLAAIRVAVRAVIAKVRALPVDCTALTGPVWWGDGWKQALDTVEEFADAWPDDGDDLAALVAELRQLADRLREAVAERDALAVEATRFRVIVAAHDGGPEARPRVNRYRIEHRASADDEWDFSPYTFDNVMDADEAMTRLRRFNFPEGELRVVRVTRSHTVVAVDIDPEATKRAAARPPDGTDPSSGIDALGP
jgi:hypothetical protein